ncbi:MAG: hypothetical protein GQ477_04665 [Nanohaloarchaea archaeon]|nr:hypothetical protein [Candidatus Nanohaloarchaea archaeon]
MHLTYFCSYVTVDCNKPYHYVTAERNRYNHEPMCSLIWTFRFLAIIL